MSAPQKATLTSTSTIAWSNADLFNGYVLLVSVLPTTIAQFGLAATTDRPFLRLPARAKVHIRDGVYDSSMSVWRTDSLTPPNSRYAAHFYDATGNFLASAAALFQITATPYTLNPPTLTAPTAPTAVPTAP